MRNLLAQLAIGFAALMVGCTASAQAKPDEPQAPRETPAESAEPVSPEALALLNKIEAASAKLDTLKARVRYSRLQALTGDEQIRFGDFYYQAKDDDAPTRFAVLFDRLVVDDKARPMQTWYIFDGNWLLERNHEDKQATRREVVPEGGERDGVLSLGDGRLPIPLRLEAEKVLKAYQVALLADEETADHTLHHLRLTPREAEKDDPLELWFDSETLLLYRVLTKVDGDTVELILPTPQPNPQIKPAIFKTALPDPDDGWQVQEVPLK